MYIVDFLNEDEKADFRQHNLYDHATYDVAYTRGYRSPRYSVPSHHYLTLMTTMSVETVTGIKKDFIGLEADDINYDCDCVFFLWRNE